MHLVSIFCLVHVGSGWVQEAKDHCFRVCCDGGSCFFFVPASVEKPVDQLIFG